MLILCKCGCGNQLEELDSKGRKRRYIAGHSSIIRVNNYQLPADKFCKGYQKLLPIKEFGLRNYKTKCNDTTYQRPRSRCILCTNNSAKEYSQKSSYKEKRKIYKLQPKTIKTWLQNRISDWRKKTPHSNLTVDYLISLYETQNGLCYYTGNELHFAKRIPDARCISLDRLNPDVGYMQGNVVFCTYFVNTMKGGLTENEFYEYMKQILVIKEKL